MVPRVLSMQVPCPLLFLLLLNDWLRQTQFAALTDMMSLSIMQALNARTPSRRRQTNEIFPYPQLSRFRISFLTKEKKIRQQFLHHGLSFPPTHGPCHLSAPSSCRFTPLVEAAWTHPPANPQRKEVFVNGRERCSCRFLS